MKNGEKLKVGAFQFATSTDIVQNLAALKRGIEAAAQENVRLLLTQECALCGYPPVEIPSIAAIDQGLQAEAFAGIVQLAQEHQIYIALGMVEFTEGGAFNSVRLIGPDGDLLRPYHKRALWGWDQDNFQSGNAVGIYEIDGVKVGVRICFEVRFPEYFRELFVQDVDLAILPFADVGQPEQAGKINIIQSHLVSRAVENAMFVLSANSISQYQLAPTCLIDPDGHVIVSAPLNEEFLLTAVIEITEPNFGRQGRISYSKLLTNEELK